MLKFENKNVKNINFVKYKYSLSNQLITYLGCLEEESSKKNPIFKIKLEKNLYSREIVGFNPIYSLLKANDNILHPDFIKPKSHKQTLNLDDNILLRETTYFIDGVNINITSTKFLDSSQAIICHKYSFYTDKEISLDFYHGIEDISYNNNLKVKKIASGNHEKLLSAKLSDKINIKHMMIYKKNFRHINNNKKNQSIEHYIINTVPKRKYTIIHYAGFFINDEKGFRKSLKKKNNQGFKTVLNNHKDSWKKEFSNYKIKVVNNIKTNNLVNYSIYQMLTNLPNKFGVIGNSFKNHAWLNDIYVSDFYLKNKPEQARNIISRRINYLVFAKEIAKKFNYRGALYLDNPKRFNQGFRQIYLNGMIAYSLDQYYENTRDMSILTEGGLLMLYEICIFYVDYAKINDKKTHFDILNVSNIDNTIQNIDNHSLTNYLINNSFKLLIKYVKLYKKYDKNKYRKIIEQNNLNKFYNNIKKVNNKLYLRQPNKKNILPVYQNFFYDFKSNCFNKKNNKINFTNDIFLLFNLFSKDFSDFIKQKNKNYYLEIFNASFINKLLASLVATKNIDEEGYVNLLDSVNIEKSSFYINEKGINHGVSGMIYNYIVFHLAKLRIDNSILTVDSLLPMDIRRIEFDLKYFGKIADIKIKRNSARLEWK